MKKKVYWLVGICMFFGLGIAIAKYSLNDARVTAARLEIQTLTNAVKSFAVNNDGQFPPNLPMLTVPDLQGKGPYVQGSLLDPWGEAINYDSAGRNNNGDLPDIWIVAPDGQEFHNW